MIDLDYNCRFITSKHLGNIYMQTFPYLLCQPSLDTPHLHKIRQSTLAGSKKKRQPEKKRL